MKVLLDTNIIIALFAKEEAVQQRLVSAAEVFVPSIVIGELYYGANKSARVKENLERIDEFAANNTVLACGTATAKEYGVIKENLRTKGRPIPENDIWIAAIAIEQHLTLATRDKHFNEVERLMTEIW